jgi:glycosyltransferase involved in cell wall biosynthesis
VRIAINARFATQAPSGVQRFAREISAALGRIAPTVMLAPGAVGGQVWEQAVLPWRVRGVLVNPANTAPLLVRRQVVVIHDAGVFSTPEAYGWRFRTWYRLLHRALAARGAKLATVSAFARGDIAARLGVDAGTIALLSEGAEHVHAAAADASVLARNGLVAGRYALTVGNLAPHKNLVALQATAELLAGRGMALAVTGGFLSQVFARERPVLPEPAITVGRVNDGELRALYEGAACFLFPSRYEGFGLPAVEAMACGCPVVAARAGALPEVCGEAALLCDPGSPAAFAAAVGRLLDEPDLADGLRAAGRARAASFTWDAAARRLLDALDLF